MKIAILLVKPQQLLILALLLIIAIIISFTLNTYSIITANNVTNTSNRNDNTNHTADRIC